MKRLSYCLIAASLLAAAPALAQTPPPKTPSRPASTGMPPRPQPQYFDTRGSSVERVEYQNFIWSSTDNNLGPQPLARIDLANRLSVLIEEGRCDEARAIAREAGETWMAVRIRQMCRPRRAD